MSFWANLHALEDSWIAQTQKNKGVAGGQEKTEFEFKKILQNFSTHEATPLPTSPTVGANS